MTGMIGGAKGWGTARFLAALGSLVAIALLIALVHIVHASFPVAERWADEQIAAGLAEPGARPDLIETYRATYGARDATGDWLPYPVGTDSYYYLRLAARIADTGRPCAGGSAEICWDDRVAAPAGRPMVDAWAPHPWSLGLLQALLGAFDRDRNIIATARTDSALLLIVLAALVYALAQLMAGPGIGGWAAGTVAAVTTCLHPIVIERSFGADDDVWTLILIALGMLLWARMCRAERPAARAGFGAATGLACGALAMSWGGWTLLPAIILAAAAVLALPALPRLAGWASVTPLSLRMTAWAIGPMILVLAAVIWLSGSAFDLSPVAAEIARIFGLSTPAEPVAAPPPDAFAFVSELHPLSLGDGFARLGWPIVLPAAAGIALASRRLREEAAAGVPSAAALLMVLTWLFCAITLAPTGQRYILLVVPPLALLAGAGIGGLIHLLFAGKLASKPPRVVLATGAIAVALWSGAMTYGAVAKVADNRPSLNSAWVLALAELRQASTGDALVLSWWDTGHWITFWSQRAVAVDGASLHNPRIHAIGRLFAADADRPIAAQVRDAACVEGGTLCPAGDVFVVLSSHLLSSDAWMVSGLWEPSRAWLVDALEAGADPGDPEAALRAGNVADESVLETADAAMAAVGHRLKRARFAAPQARIWSSDWQPCGIESDGSYLCPLNLTSTDGWAFENFRVDPRQPGQARFAIRQAGNASAPATDLAPSTLRLATEAGLYQVLAPAPGDTNPGALFDAVNHRLFVGTPAVLRSLVARLLLLEGRYDSRRFARLASYSTVEGETVQVWRVIANPIPNDRERPGGLSEE